MKWLDNLIERKLDEAIQKRQNELDELESNLKRLRETVDVRIEEIRHELAGIEGEIRDVDKFLKHIERAVSVKENIETVRISSEWLKRALYDHSERTLAKTYEYNPDADDWREEAIPFTVSPEKPFGPKRIRSGFGFGINSIKFIEGDGYGKYEIILNGLKRSFFLKRKNGNEDGVILIHRLLFCQMNSMLQIRQVEGEGTLKCALLGVVAGPNKQIFFESVFV